MSNQKLAWFLLVCIVLVGTAVLLLDGYIADTAESALDSCSIIITEICTKNESVIADNDEKYRDYIELYNAGDTICLDGFTLTDGKVTCNPFGSVIFAAGSYRVVFLGDSVTGFALGASGGDCIQLLDPDGNIVAQANTATLLADQVMLYRNGGYEISYDASPGYANNLVGLSAFRKGTFAETLDLVISEVLLGNVSSLPDENGFFVDVLELHNDSDQSINLGEFFLSDSLEQRYRFRLPDVVLESGAYEIIYCDGQNYVGEGGEIHANFSISHGETLVLTDGQGCYSSILASHCGDDVSMSLTEDGAYDAYAVSLGYDNTIEGAALFYQSRINTSSSLVISEVLLSSGDVPYNGSFCDVVEIVNASFEPVSTAGWYLSDGGDPYGYALPEQILQPDECIIVICSPQTTGFSLSEGEILRLMAPDCSFAAPVTCIPTEQGMSISMQQEGDSLSYSLMNITLGYPNIEENHDAYRRTQLTGGLEISEVMTANLSYLPGAYATTSDWIELHNTSDAPIQLSDYCLTDDSGSLTQYALPEMVLEAGHYCVLFLKTDPTNLRDGYAVLPFTLSSRGEQLYLTKDGCVVDYVFLPELETDESYGRSENSAVFSLLRVASPGEANGASAEKSAMPVASVPQGSYDNVSSLEIELFGVGDIYYTTDCTTPDADANHYTGPIRLTQTTVLRVICREPGKVDSEVLNLTYLINENDSLPAVSVVTDPDNLWSDAAGIYTMGPNAQEEFPHFGANFWYDWERPASVSLLEKDGSGFRVNCGIKIFGGYTIAMPKKSLSCIFRDVYGASELAYPLFGEESLDTYEAFVLRSTGQDALKARMRDVVVTSLFEEYTDVPVQDYKPVVVYLNGEYWGIYFIREKINSNYLAGHYNVPPDTLSVVKLGGWSCPEYIDLVRYTAYHDMTDPQCYDYVCSQIDVDNYIDFLAAEMWLANTDNGNVKYFVSPEGKWTWFMYDTDLALMDYNWDATTAYFGTYGIGPDDYTCKTFAAKLIHNPEFRDKFLRRLAWQMNTIWTEENVLRRIDEIESLIIADMPKECTRWDTEYFMWEINVEEIRTFARNRSDCLLNQIRSWFQLTDDQMREYGFEVR